LAITAEQQQALARAQRRDYGRRLLPQLAARAQEIGYPAPTEDTVDGWLSEGVAAGVERASDLTDLCHVLMEMAWAGARPPEASARLSDPEVGGRLKVFQVRHAWREQLERR